VIEHKNAALDKGKGATMLETGMLELQVRIVPHALQET
jgi:hypothetical protein